MVGLVIVCHGALGAELVRVAELIAGKVEGVEAVSIGSQVDVDKAREEVAAALARVKGDDGALILTDMFGGTPSNIALSFLGVDGVEVLTGVNLPMLIKFANHRKDKPLKELVTIVKEGGLKAIIVAGEMLSQKVKK